MKEEPKKEEPKREESKKEEPRKDAARGKGDLILAELAELRAQMGGLLNLLSTPAEKTDDTDEEDWF